MDFRSKRNFYSGDLFHTSKQYLSGWVASKTVVSNTKYLETDTITCNRNKCKLCDFCNNVNGTWSFNCKSGHN